MSTNVGTEKISTTLVMGEVYRSAPRLVTGLGAALAGLVTLAALITIA